MVVLNLGVAFDFISTHKYIFGNWTIAHLLLGFLWRSLRTLTILWFYDILPWKPVRLDTSVLFVLHLLPILLKDCILAHFPLEDPHIMFLFCVEHGSSECYRIGYFRFAVIPEEKITPRAMNRANFEILSFWLTSKKICMVSLFRRVR